MPSEKLIKIAQIIDAHGIKGEVKLRYFSDDVSLLEKNPVLLDASGKKKLRIKITGKTKNSVIVRVDGVNDRNSAELLKNTELYIHSSVLPETAEGEFYHNDLIGLEVRLDNGSHFGTIQAIHNFGAGDIVEIATVFGSSEMLPLREPWITDINIKEGYITVLRAEYL